MLKTYKILLNGEEIEIEQDEDGKFIKPFFIKELESEGTALKPACEPIVVARKPLSEKNVALNVLKWGTGGINIDECRIEGKKGGNPNRWIGQRGEGRVTLNASKYKDSLVGQKIDTTKGRFPSNIILDEESAKMLDEESGVSKSLDTKRNRETLGSFGMPNDLTPEYSDKGGASRFFKNIEKTEPKRFAYIPKASKSERNFGLENTDIPEKPIPINEPHNSKDLEERYSMTSKNNHPTVKPIKLMEYLIKLVTKEGAIVLDPFIGSGTTVIACLKLNRRFIGIEKEEEYVKIANARIKPYLEQQKLK